MRAIQDLNHSINTSGRAGGLHPVTPEGLWNCATWDRDGNLDLIAKPYNTDRPEPLIFFKRWKRVLHMATGSNSACVQGISTTPSSISKAKVGKICFLRLTSPLITLRLFMILAVLDLASGIPSVSAGNGCKRRLACMSVAWLRGLLFTMNAA